MFQNPYLRKQLEDLGIKKSELGRRKQTNNLLINSSKLTRNARRYIDPKKINKDALSLVENAITENMEIDKQLRVYKEEIQKLSSQIQTERNMALMNLFKEIFEESQLRELYSEVNRRVNNETPFKISFAWKDFNEHKSNATKYKKLTINYIDKMIEFRILLTGLIDKGCEQFGKAEFLKFISPLNTHIIPVNELEKIKRKIIG